MAKIIFLVLLIGAQYRQIGAQYQKIVYNPNYEHDKWQTRPIDIERKFSAYTVSFDGKDSKDGKDGKDKNDDYVLGVPEWVAYEIKPLRGRELEELPKPPNVWISERGFPDDTSYRDRRYEKGQMCPNFIAWRLGEKAYWNTHTILNACPQFTVFRRGIWKDLEKFTAQWADESGESVWVICGPVFMQMAGVSWIGKEKNVAVPDAFYKIIVQEREGQLDVLAFMYLHLEKYPRKGPYHHAKYLVSVNYIELHTGLDFFTALEDELEERIENRRPKRLWGNLSKR
ncbi:MAG: DNA/RNA non-specific endonuclease [Planctomycetes bacterium]|nr:DNA/RNA non-specific endonuclease [Planctomycetota bacterium]